jgi:chromosomal replication initiator protein
MFRVVWIASSHACHQLRAMLCGSTTELQPPDTETRMGILRKKAEAFHIPLAEDVLAFLAQRVRTNVRRLDAGWLLPVAEWPRV